MKTEESTSNIETVVNQKEKSTGKLKSSKYAVAGFILGLISILAFVTPFTGFPISISGLIFSILGIKSKKRKIAVAGVILSGLFLIFTFFPGDVLRSIGWIFGRLAKLFD